MRFTVLAVAGGLLLGLAAGGRPSGVARAAPRWWGMLLAGIALQWAPELFGTSDGTAAALVGMSYACLAVFAVANLGLTGMPVVLVGLALNATVILANGGMPVRADAVVGAGIAERDEVATLDFGAKRHLEDGDDRLTALGDVVPVPVLEEVLSFGDLILAVGIADVVFRLLVPVGSRKRTRRRTTSPDPEVDLGAPDAAPARALERAGT